MAARRNIGLARVGNYSAPVESTGDAAMDKTLFGKTRKMDKTEDAYVAGAKNRESAKAAVQKARKANKQLPAPE